MQFDNPTCPIALRELMAQVEKERARNQECARNSHSDGLHIFRCRRLAEIRESLKLLAETYEVK